MVIYAIIYKVRLNHKGGFAVKKIVSLLLVLSMVCCLSLTGCKKTVTTASKASTTYEIGLITDVGNIDDKSFNQGAWEGVEKYAKDNNITYAYYRPTEDSTVARVDSISAAIDKGAKVIVCPGYLFEEAIYNVQDTYPDTQFLLLDGQPHDANYNYKTSSNVHCILYKEEQAGYLAGYAAVKDGYTKLGFLGGMAVPAVERYGYGYVQGANDAAKEMGNKDKISMKYWYSGVFAANDDIKTKMSGWYTDGTEVIFSCGGGIYLSAVAAAQASKSGKVIGVDVDQSSESDLIITSAMKGLTNSVVIAMTKLYANNGKWDADYAGKTSTLGAADDCVGLPTAQGSWRFKTFTVSDYNTLFTKVKNGDITISNSTDKAPTVDIKVDYQNK